MPKVLKYTIADFRGISGVLTVDLSDPKKHRANSLILFGDNGSGKSSIVDALEFGLRGRLSRRSAAGVKQRREVRNLSSPRHPGVLVELDDFQTVRRGGGHVDKQVPLSRPNQIVEGFQFSPIIIRRQDIESFWRVPEAERQAFFFDYLRDYTSVIPGDTREKLEAELGEAEEDYVKVAGRMAQLAATPQRSLPSTLGGANSFYRRILLPRFGKKNKTTGKMQLTPKYQKAFDEFSNAARRLGELTGNLRALPEPGPMVDRELSHILRSLSARVTADFLTVARLEWIERVTISTGGEAELHISLILSNGQAIDPIQVLSEAALDLLALLILLEVHVECRSLGQSPLIILDDVFQSVDTINRIRVLDHSLGRLKGWQIIVTLHDRLWLELVRKAMSRAGVSFILSEVVPGNFGEMPILRSAKGHAAEELRGYIAERESTGTLAASSGRVLEELCDRLSVSLATKIARRPNDRYTLGDLWPGVNSAISKHGETQMKKAAEEVSRFIDLRNLIGAHYNEWGATLASQEAIDFGSSTIELWDSCTCPACGSVYSRYSSSDGKSSLYAWPCDCRAAHTEAGEA